MPANCASVRTFASSSFFFFNDTATTEIYTLSLYDALPISTSGRAARSARRSRSARRRWPSVNARSEEHTSELQSQFHLVCRLLLEKKNINSSRPRPKHAASDSDNLRVSSLVFSRVRLSYIR